MGKKFINREVRRDIVLLMHVQSVMQSLIEKWEKLQSVPFKLRWLRSANTILSRFLTKSVVEAADLKDMERAIDYFKRSRLLLKTNEAAALYMERWEREYGEEKIEVPVRYLDEMMTIAMAGSCYGCEGIEDCYLKKILEAYDVASVTASPNICKYETKKG